MADGTKIEWADATVNAINGCSVVSPGCTNCYAMRLAGTRLRNHPSRAGLTVPSKAGPVWNGTVRLSESALVQPLRWRRPRVIFWNAHGDPFHPAVPFAWVDRMFAVSALSPHHKHLVLTKRPERMRAYFADGSWAQRVSAIINDWPEAKIGTGNEYIGDLWLMKRGAIKNVWLGTSAEDQPRLDERIDHLINTPRAFGRYLSLEPLLGPIILPRVDFHCDLCGGTGMLARWPRGRCHDCGGRGHIPAISTDPKYGTPSVPMRWINGVIVGGESGHGARPKHPDWSRSLRDQCAAAGVDFHFKQWGEWAPCRVDETGDGDFIAWSGDGRVPPQRFGSKQYATAEGQWMARVGKSAAGRLLDGVTHDALPWRVSTSLDTNGG